MTRTSSILYQNPSATVFLIDIPASIALAQELSSDSTLDRSVAVTTCKESQIDRPISKRRHILSSIPREEPFPANSEPKSEAKREKLLAQIPQSERELYEEITPLVTEALKNIKENYHTILDGKWCLHRHILSDLRSVKKDRDESGPDSGLNDSGLDGPRVHDEQNAMGYRVWTPDLPRGTKKRRIQVRECLQELREIARSNERGIQDHDNDDLEMDSQIHTACFGMQNSQRGLGLTIDEYDQTQMQIQAPLILSPGRNRFEDEVAVTYNLVKNTSRQPAIIDIHRLFPIKSITDQALKLGPDCEIGPAQIFHVPPLSNFILSSLPISVSALLQQNRNPNPIPHLPPDQKFNLVILDPPWANKSVRRSRHYKTQTYSESELLTGYIRSVLTVHSHQPGTLKHGDASDVSIAAIWTTNSAKSRDVAYGSLTDAGFLVIEEWIWVKTTTNGQPVTPIDGLWRKPYEILVIGQREMGEPGQRIGHRDDASYVNTAQASDGGDKRVLRRVIAAVPDVHSRKPNLKELLERVFFTTQSQSQSQPELATPSSSTTNKRMQYTALEVFARNLTAGWWAVGDEVLKFNSEGWWIDADDNS